MPNLSTENIVTETKEEITPEETAQEEVTEEEEQGFLGKASEFLKSTTDGAIDIVTTTTSNVAEAARTTVAGVRAVSTGVKERYQTAQAIVVTLVSKSDELIAAMMAVFAAYIFKTAVLPLLILYALTKVSGGIGIGAREEFHEVLSSMGRGQKTQPPSETKS